MPPELRGFYFDEEKGRYFPLKAEPAGLSASGEREQKRKRVKLQKEEDARELKNRRNSCFTKYVHELVRNNFVVHNGKDFTGALKLEAAPHETYHFDSFFERQPYALELSGHQFSRHLICERNVESGFMLIATTQDGLVLSLKQVSGEDEFGVVAVTMRDYVSNNNEPFESLDMVLKLSGSSFQEMGSYCHMAGKEATTHKFIRTTRGPDIQNNSRILELGGFRNVYDSANLGRFFVVATDSSLQLFNWDDHSARAYQGLKPFKGESDILCLAARDENPLALYVGTRNGWLHAVPISPEGTLSSSFTKSFKLPGVRSVVSIKTFDADHLVFVSAIANDTQTLILVDTMLPAQECVVATFRTSFSNLTRDQEYFEVAPDGRFLLYGSASGSSGCGDFEVFSSHLADNFVHKRQNKAVTFFPLKTFRTEMLGLAGYHPLPVAHIRGVAFLKNDSDERSISLGTEAVYDTSQQSRYSLAILMSFEYTRDDHSESLTYLLARRVL